MARGAVDPAPLVRSLRSPSGVRPSTTSPTGASSRRYSTRAPSDRTEERFVVSTATVSVPPARLFLGGRWVETDATRPVLNPATEDVVGEAPEGTLEHVQQALEAARAAQPAWARRSYVQRADVVQRIVALVRERAEELARLVVAEQG